MRTSGDVYGADARSSRSDEERAFAEEELNDSTRNRQDDSNSRPGSQRSVKSSRKQEEETDSDSSSSKNTTRNKPIQYTDQQQAELLRKLDSIKDHLLRGGANANANANVIDQPPPMGFHPSYYNPYPYGMYPTTSNQTPVPAYRDPYGFPMHRNPQNFYPGPAPYPNQMLPHPPYPPQGQYVDIGPDIFDPQLQDPRFFPVTPSRYGDVPYSPVVHHGEKTGPFSPHAGVQGRHTRWPSEIDSEMGGAAFARGYVQKAVSDSDSRRCHPLAGGAPFIACHCCFELLYLPKKKLLGQERQQKLQCGACSAVISFTVVDKKLVFSSSALAETTNQVSEEVEDRRAPRTVVDDYPLKDEEPRIHQKIKVSLSEHSDDEDRSSISSEPQKQVVKSVRRKAQGAKVPPPENSNLLELFEYSNVNRAAITYGMAQLGYNKQQSYMRQDSLKPESVATETDVSYNEYYNNTEVSEDSGISKASKEESRPRNRKQSSEYGFPEVTNKIISNDQNNDQLEVWVNGHLIPEDLVIRAEKQAGPVQAGKYWYVLVTI